MQRGLHAANSIVRGLKGQPANPFKYRDVGSAATIGRFRSVVNFHGLRLSGFAGWVVWAWVVNLPATVPNQVGHDEGGKEEEQAEDEEQQPTVTLATSHAGRPEGQPDQDEKRDDPEPGPPDPSEGKNDCIHLLQHTPCTC
jgi:hypothetical protein